MIVKRVGNIELTEENKKFYKREGYELTGETLEVAHEDGTECTYVVFTGKWTRAGSVRDCGDHYILATYSRWLRIDKATLEVTTSMEDE